MRKSRFTEAEIIGMIKEQEEVVLVIRPISSQFKVDQGFI